MQFTWTEQDALASGVASQMAVSSVRRWLFALFAGCAVVGALAFVAGHPQARLEADPSLSLLLRGMAVIKGLIAACAVALVAWRLRYPLSGRQAAGYLVSAWLMVGASVSIWQLSFIVAAALAFHVGALALVLIGWRDGLPARRMLPRRAADSRVG